MFKKVLFLCVIMSSIAFAASVPKDSVEMRIKQFNEYKQLVDSNREKEIARNTPSKEEIEIQLMKEKQEFEKQIREQRRDNLVNTVLIGGIGYGGYRIGRHHRWW